MTTATLERKQVIRRTTPKISSDKKTLRVIELFAGVGGFRVGFEKINAEIGKEYFKTVWSNQWEPGSRIQHASDIYVKKFGKEGHSNEDISTVKINDIPDHDILVGGFPCQDYSVARTLSQADGIVGKKGVLWWQIHRILKEKGNKRPSFILLENVDRLLKSPAKNRGRDFALMLASLSDLGYIVEWRVINAAEYGMPQRRRRVFIMGYLKGSDLYKSIRAGASQLDWIIKDGTMAKAFPVSVEEDPLLNSPFDLKGDLSEITKNFGKGLGSESPFENAGIIVDRRVLTLAVKPNYKGKFICIGDLLIDEKDVPQEYFIKKDDLPMWKYLKGPKKEERSSKEGFKFFYCEGGMFFPDPIDKPARTIITSEGGPNPSRFKHVIKTPSGKLRRLTPIELERINQFPDNHTVGIPDLRRAFVMGNALVVGIVEKLGQQLLEAINCGVQTSSIRYK